MEVALQQNFRRMDEMLESTEGNKELLEIRQKATGDFGTMSLGETVSSNAGTVFII